MHIIGTNLEIQNGFILLKDEETGELKLSGSIGVSPENAKHIVYKEGEGIIGKVFKFGLPMFIMDIDSEPDFHDKLVRKNTAELDFMAVPIRTSKETFGVLAIDKLSEAVTNNESYLDFLKMTSNLLAAFIQKMDLIQKERAKLEAEKERLQSEVTEKYSYKGLVGSSKIMREVFKKIDQVKNAQTTVFIRGESGTGKELVARAIHYSGNRAKKPFITVNCAAIPSELIESELFGHKKGSFTGAYADKKGKFESAERVGSNRPKQIDVRVIAATNKNLKEMVDEKTFREDLYYRLNVINLLIPPLRDRKEDIGLLSRHFLEKLNQQNHGKIKGVSEKAQLLLTSYLWKGNIRELRNVIERAYNIIEGEEYIQPYHLPMQLKASEDNYVGDPLRVVIENVEKKIILERLLYFKGNKTKTAEDLGISRMALHKKLDKFDLK